MNKVTVKLICAFVFVYANCWFSHVAAHIIHNEGWKCDLLKATTDNAPDEDHRGSLSPKSDVVQTVPVCPTRENNGIHRENKYVLA